MKRWLSILLLAGWCALAAPVRADLTVAQGTFTKRNGTGTQAVVISPAFTPKVIAFWGTNQTAVGAIAGGNDWMGWTSGTPAAQHYAIAAYNMDNVAASDTETRVENAAIVIVVGPTALTIVGSAVLSSFNSDGFTLNWTTSDANAYIIYYLALGGTDITNVIVLKRDWSNATGNRSFAGLGFQPNFIMTIGGGDGGTNVPNSNGDYLRDFGAALSTSNRWTVAASAQDGDTMSPFVAGRRLVTTEMASKLTLSGSAVLAAADFVSFDSDGWTWNQTTAPAAIQQFGFVAFKFADVANNVAIGTLTACTGTNCTVNTTTGQGAVKGVLLFSRSEAIGTTITDNAILDVGGSDFTNEGTAAAVHQETTGGNTNVNQQISSSRAIQLIIEDGTIFSEADASAIANGFRTTWPIAGSGNMIVAYISFGEAAAGGPAGKPTRPPIVIGVNGERRRGAESIGAAALRYRHARPSGTQKPRKRLSEFRAPIRIGATPEQRAHLAGGGAVARSAAELLAAHLDVLPAGMPGGRVLLVSDAEGFFPARPESSIAALRMTNSKKENENEKVATHGWIDRIAARHRCLCSIACGASPDRTSQSVQRANRPASLGTDCGG